MIHVVFRAQLCRLNTDHQKKKILETFSLIGYRITPLYAEIRNQWLLFWQNQVKLNMTSQLRDPLVHGFIQGLYFRTAVYFDLMATLPNVEVQFT